jgi:CHAT domain-containing protein
LLRRRDPLALLHVAAHGVFHRDHWLLTGIQPRDGWLGFEALQRRWARGALLTFGSCESGLRVDTPHGELDGWLAAGLGAGAHELVLTLWKLDDEAAASFAEAFYPLWTSGVPAPQAAAIARAALRDRLAHPYSWAPFIAVG